ncbi:EF-hand domain-containing protein [Pseudolabrys taiwanensis]|uniref:EF-hand domain-containing protein n=1 Tax=Pseudolabrys taiwanensis TaxID=331696 RepID=A0A346A3A9_9HYPH|nr:EF-hand domain-containing protein [Pseudolabrys taiwanensis]AXK83656.1 EF-hand domain-containing protein [Pseudolabrys taiwanensis]
MRPFPDRRRPFRLSLLTGGVLVALSAVLAQAQTPGLGGPPGRAPAPDPFVASMARWDANHDGTLTCDEWRQYANRLFTLADKNADGFLDATEFRSLQKMEPLFADADMSYFDDNHDRRVSRAEFVDKPSPFFARYDTNHDCRVTPQEISGTPEKAAPRGGGHRGGGGGGMGMGGGRGGF